MDNNFNSAITDFTVNMVEYCTLVKDIILPGTTSAYVKIHKLMPYCTEINQKTSSSMFINDEDCEVILEGSLTMSSSIKVSLFDATYDNLGKPIFSKVVDQEGSIITVQTGTKIPKGTQMMVLFMDNNINDGYLTNWIAKMEGTDNGI